MSQNTKPRWESLRTPDSQLVEAALRPKFPNTDAYRFNSASIRVRIVDPRFDGKSAEERDAMVEPLLDRLPPNIQRDIMNLLTLSPNETDVSLSKNLANIEFEDPSSSSL